MKNVSELDAFLHPQKFIPSQVRFLLVQIARKQKEEPLFRNNPLCYWKRQRYIEIQQILKDFDLLKFRDRVPNLRSKEILLRYLNSPCSEELFSAIQNKMPEEEFLQLAEDRNPVLGKMTDEEKEIFFPKEEIAN